MKGYVTIANSKDAANIFALRLVEYQRNTKDIEWIHADQLKWDGLDERGKVFVVWDSNGNPISTMATIIILTKEDAEYILEVTIPENVLYPALLLRRAATAVEYQYLGLNTLLRYYIFKSCLQSEIKTVIGAIYKNAPRSNTLSKIGYTTVECGLPRQRGFIEKSETELVILEHPFFTSAIKKLNELTQTMMENFPLTFHKASHPIK